MSGEAQTYAVDSGAFEACRTIQLSLETTIASKQIIWELVCSHFIVNLVIIHYNNQKHTGTTDEIT